MLFYFQATKAHLEDAVKYLNEVASRQTFKYWELPEALNRVKYEISGLAPQVYFISWHIDRLKWFVVVTFNVSTGEMFGSPPQSSLPSGPWKLHLLCAKASWQDFVGIFATLHRGEFHRWTVRCCSIRSAIGQGRSHRTNFVPTRGIWQTQYTISV